ncbi:MAG: peptide-methionine (S)-S-oxide reductase MsrA [Verrucomicrobia bacterium]|nr:peptide-methionine (S)-S-oxide reductase MsrA [Verrucomicrobiota bacterium]
MKTLHIFAFITLLGAQTAMSETAPTELATFGGGCFWCVEAVFQQIDGVKSVKSGYAGGETKNPTYKEVCSGRTGHAEVVQVEYDPTLVSYDALLLWFWKAHDPTQLNRQGADSGTQYRSIILYHNDEQKQAAEKSKAEAQKKFSRPVVTEISPMDVFYPAEDYHQDYYSNNKTAGYCNFVISPKLEKLGLKK